MATYFLHPEVKVKKKTRKEREGGLRGGGGGLRLGSTPGPHSLGYVSTAGS